MDIRIFSKESDSSYLQTWFKETLSMDVPRENFVFDDLILEELTGGKHFESFVLIGNDFRKPRLSFPVTRFKENLPAILQMAKNKKIIFGSIHADSVVISNEVSFVFWNENHIILDKKLHKIWLEENKRFQLVFNEDLIDLAAVSNTLLSEPGFQSFGETKEKLNKSNLKSLELGSIKVLGDEIWLLGQILLMKKDKKGGAEVLGKPVIGRISLLNFSQKWFFIDEASISKGYLVNAFSEFSFYENGLLLGIDSDSDKLKKSFNPVFGKFSLQENSYFFKGFLNLTVPDLFIRNKISYQLNYLHFHGKLAAFQVAEEVFDLEAEQMLPLPVTQPEDIGLWTGKVNLNFLVLDIAQVDEYIVVASFKDRKWIEIYMYSTLDKVWKTKAQFWEQPESKSFFALQIDEDEQSVTVLLSDKSFVQLPIEPLSE
jgi:hypothetical protein